MNVAQLIKRLQKYDPKARVRLRIVWDDSEHDSLVDLTNVRLEKRSLTIGIPETHRVEGGRETMDYTSKCWEEVVLVSK